MYTTSTHWVLGSNWEVMQTATAVACVLFAAWRWHSCGVCSEQPNSSLRPAPGCLPLLGHALTVGLNFHRIFDWMHEVTLRMKGATWFFSLPFTSMYIVVSNPRIVEYVLKTRLDNYPKGRPFHRRIGALLGDGIFTADGPAWHAQRKLAANIFSVRSFKEYFGQVFEAKFALLSNRLDAAATAAASAIAADRDASAAGVGMAAAGWQWRRQQQQQQTQGSVVDLTALFYAFTMDSFAQIGFGADPGCLRLDSPPPFAQAFDRAQQVCNHRFWNPAWMITEVLTCKRWQLARDVATVRDFAADIIQQRRRGSSYTTHVDLLSMYMDSAGPDGKLPTDDQLIDFVINFIIAGRDTTALALSWTFHLLSQHPEVERKLLAEAAAVLAESPAQLATADSGPTTMQHDLHNDADAMPATAVAGAATTAAAVSDSSPPAAPLLSAHSAPDAACGTEQRQQPVVTYDHIRRMRYANAVFLEALRLYPSVPSDCKFALEADVLPDGTRVPPGAVLIYAPYVINRRQALWGPDAEVFRPERWLERPALPSAYEYPTFNAGPRTCLGKTLAELEGVYVLVRLLLLYQLTPLPGQDIAYSVSTTLAMKQGLKVRVAARATAS